MKKTALSFLIPVMLLVPVVAGAQFNSPGQPSSFVSQGQTQNCNGLSCTSIENPLSVKSFCALIKLLFSALVQLGIPVAVIFLILAGARYVFAMGNPTAISKAHDTLKWTVIGIALFLGAWLIVMAIAATLSQLGVTLISC